MRQGLCLLAFTYLTITPLFALDYRVFPGVGSKEAWKRAYVYNDKAISCTDHKQSLSLLNQAIAIYPYSSLFYSNAGSAALDMKDFPKALSLYKKALELNSGNTAALSGLGAVYLEQKKYADAEKYCREAMAMDPKDTISAINLAEVYIQTSRAGQGKALLLEIKSKTSDPDDLKEINIWMEKANRMEGK